MKFFNVAANPLEHVVPHPIKKVPFPTDLGFLTPDGKVTFLSDQIVMMILGGILVSIVVPWMVRGRRAKSGVDAMVPGKGANFVEMICQYFRKEVAEPHLGEYADRFIGFIWTAFFFVLTLNLLGLIPLASLNPYLPGGLYLGGTATGNIWVTGTLAFMTLALMVFNGLRFGGTAYLAHFSPGPLWMAPIMIPVEVMGMFAKVCALAMRLFANMVAGHILLAVLIMLIGQAGQALGTAGGLGIAAAIVVGSVAINLLEIFVAFLQAFIFTYLSTLFIGMSVNVHHDHHDEHATEDLQHAH